MYVQIQLRNLRHVSIIKVTPYKRPISIIIRIVTSPFTQLWLLLFIVHYAVCEHNLRDSLTAHERASSLLLLVQEFQCGISWWTLRFLSDLQVFICVRATSITNHNDVFALGYFRSDRIGYPRLILLLLHRLLSRNLLWENSLPLNPKIKGGRLGFLSSFNLWIFWLNWASVELSTSPLLQVRDNNLRKLLGILDY